MEEKGFEEYLECKECGIWFIGEYGCETTCSTRCYWDNIFIHMWKYDGWKEFGKSDLDYYNRYKSLWDQLMSEKPIGETLGSLRCGNWVNQIAQINRIARRLNIMRWEPSGQDWAKQ